MLSSKFSGEKAFEFLKEIDFPRRTGSVGNKKAFEIITEKLEKFGYKIEVNKFRYTHSYVRELLLYKLGITIFFFLTAFLALIAYWSDPISKIIFLLISIISAIITIILLLFNFFNRINHYLKEKFLEELPSEETYELPEASNIIIEKRPKKKSDLHVIIGAHYDSISINFNFLFYTIIYLISGIGTLFVSVYYIFLDIFLIGSTSITMINYGIIIGLILSSVVSVSLLCWLNVKLKNESHGASDNGSGVSILIELARILKDFELNFNLTLIFFGVEEEGLLGSINYVKLNLEQFKKEKIMMISLDTLGTSGKLKYASGHGLKKKYSPELIKKLKEAADQVNVKIIPQWLPYPSSDHAPFVFHNISATQIFKNLTIANTVQDTIDRIDINSLEETGKILVQFLMNLNT